VRVYYFRSSMPKFFIKTYGCQMNERDSEQVAHSLIARGYERVAHEREADVVLLNTCSVRDMADQKALGKMGMLGRMARDRPHMVFGFLGCMAQARGEVLLENLPHVDLVVGTQKFHRVADYVEELVAKKTGRSRPGEQAQLAPNQNRAMDDLRFSIVDIAEEPGSQSTIRNQQLAPRQATAFVSIMQGCNMHCTFCIVPQTRGMERSRSIDEIVREVRDLVEHGVKEVTLLGQIVNLYGRHEFPKRDGKSPFVQLLEAVNEIGGLERLRFTSPHPIGFRDDLIDAISRVPKLTEHIHLPLQSGSNRILKAMHRAYTAEKYVDLVRAFNTHARALPLPLISSWDFQARPTTITSVRAIWLKNSSLITRSFFAIRRAAIRPPRKCAIKSMSASKNSGIRICSRWLMNQRAALANASWDALLKFFAKARVRPIQHG